MALDPWFEQAKHCVTEVRALAHPRGISDHELVQMIQAASFAEFGLFEPYRSTITEWDRRLLALFAIRWE